MRFLAAFLCLILVFVPNVFAELSESEYQILFSTFVSKYNKNYEHTEFFSRYNTFKLNLARINEHNAAGHSYTLGVNEYADLSSQEFASQMNGYRSRPQPYIRKSNEASFDEIPVSALPTAVDWRSTSNPKHKVAVTPVQNQQQCGSCWAFSAVAATEGAWALKAGNQLVKLSEQQLVDCSTSFGNQGCNGGLMDQAFEYYIADGGACTEASYPYQAVGGTCQKCTPVAFVSGYKDIQTMNETAMQIAVSTVGPLSVAIEADQFSFQFYSGGVFSDTTCGTNLDHGVTVVGYGFDSSVNLPYWIVKNSWGNTWGEAGYIRMERNVDICGIATDPSYPIAK